MAFLKYANAAVVKPAISMAGWDEVRTRALTMGPAFDMRKAASKVVSKFRPDQYLLSHCTIIASVDTEMANLPLGRQLVDGFQIDRAYNDYLVTANTTKYINNNHDCWERKLLLSCFRTFVGGENYVEHLQIPELSKGKIIDAAARDIGDSIYVDILVATDLQHVPLIKAIESGQLQTLSMGCQVGFTICTKCGNSAVDETQLCPHIRYMKGNTFLDGLGRKRKIAELCGHITAEPGSVKFIEASWVANPAFTGAVLRNILSPGERALLNERIQVAMSMPTREVDPNAMVRAARLLNQVHDEKVVQRPFVTQASAPRGSYLPKGYESKVHANTAHYGAPTRTRPANPKFGVAQPQTYGFEVGDEYQGSPDQGGGQGDAPKAEENPMDKAISEMADLIREKALSKVRSEMGKEDVPRVDLHENRNDTLIKQAVQRSPIWRGIAKVVLASVKDPVRARRILVGLLLHKTGGWRSVQAADDFSGAEMLAISRFLDRFNGTPRMAGEGRVYRTVLAVGGAASYGDAESYLAACRRAMGRDLTGTEKDALVAKGRIYDLGSTQGP